MLPLYSSPSLGARRMLHLPPAFSRRGLVAKIADNGGARDVHPEKRHPYRLPFLLTGSICFAKGGSGW